MPDRDDKRVAHGWGSTQKRGHPERRTPVDSTANQPRRTLLRRGQSRIGNFLQAIGLIPDCAEAHKHRCLPHDLRPLDPRSARFARHLSLCVALRDKNEDTHLTTGANAVVESQRMATSVAYDISVKPPVRQWRRQRLQTPAASSRPWRLRSSRFRKPPGVADALHPVLVDGFGFLHHGLDATDDAPVG